MAGGTSLNSHPNNTCQSVRYKFSCVDAGKTKSILLSAFGLEAHWTRIKYRWWLGCALVTKWILYCTRTGRWSYPNMDCYAWMYKRVEGFPPWDGWPCHIYIYIHVLHLFWPWHRPSTGDCVRWKACEGSWGVLECTPVVELERRIVESTEEWDAKFLCNRS